MTVQELITRLQDGYNPDAEVHVTAHCRAHKFSIAIGGGEGVTRDTAETVSIYVDSLNTKDNTSVTGGAEGATSDE